MSKWWMRALDSFSEFVDHVNTSLGRESREEWNKRKLQEHYDKLQSLDYLLMSEVLSEVMDFWESGLYHDLVVTYGSRDEILSSRVFKVEELSNNELMVLAKENLLPKSVRTMALKITDVNVFKTMHAFLETIYINYHGPEMTWEDNIHIYFGGCAERLLMGLDKFDEYSRTPRPTKDFFKKLAITQITRKETNEVENNMFLLLLDIESEIFGMGFGDSYNDFSPTMSGFIQLLAGCSAAHNNREFTAPEDIIMAYKTFFKLVKTDITVYRAPQSIVESMPEFTGYLVCDKCGVSHGLGPEDSADDFEDVCDCGGLLVYKESI
ncbi:hypothetical protein [Sediminibacterium sp.]|uniref:hypothetical protein n=1 Tax=Sediminibacterium sp. TaxID=1917865 RepID=UPI0027372091|nr:hypothetical protein [Sediminibacterium sp.]MDP3568972.1 hypothetical protein [Sediminibacterium sp.]